MGLFGRDPAKEGEQFAASADRFARAIRDAEERRLLKAGLSAAKQLMFDESFAPRSVADLQEYSATHGDAMRTILSLPPEVQDKVWATVGMWKKVLGEPVPPAVQQILSSLGIDDPTAPGVPQRVSQNLLQLVASAPGWAAQNKDLLQMLQEAGKEMGPRYKAVSPGQGLFNEATGEVEAAWDDPFAQYKVVGNALVDMRTGRPVYEAPRGDEEWSAPQQIPGLGGLWQRGPGGKLQKVDDSWPVKMAKDAILRAHGASEFSGLDPDLQPKVLAEFEEAERLIRESGYSPMQAARAAVSKWTTEDVVKPVPEKRRSGLLGTRETDTAEAAKTLAQSFRKAMSTGQKVYKSQVMKELIAKGYSPDEAQQIIDQARGMVQ